MHLKNKPVSPKWIAGFFILFGLIVLLWAFYDSGRLKVPEEIAHDQMGNAIETKKNESCNSDVHFSVAIKSTRQQRQAYTFLEVFPGIAQDDKIRVVLCDDSESIINFSNHSKYAILAKHNKKYYLLTKENNNAKRKPLQIKHMDKL